MRKQFMNQFKLSIIFDWRNSQFLFFSHCDDFHLFFSPACSVSTTEPYSLHLPIFLLFCFKIDVSGGNAEKQEISSDDEIADQSQVIGDSEDSEDHIVIETTPDSDSTAKDENITDNIAKVT